MPTDSRFEYKGAISLHLVLESLANESFDAHQSFNWLARSSLRIITPSKRRRSYPA